MSKMLEANFQKQVIKFLEHEGHYVINQVYAPAGTPDLIVCAVGGRFVGLELKVGHKLTELQKLKLKNIQKLGGIGIEFRYHKGWKETLRKELK